MHVKIIGNYLSVLILSGCVQSVPLGHIGSSVKEAEILQKKYNEFEVSIFKLNSKLSSTFIKRTLVRIGIEFTDDDECIKFKCTRATLIGFLTTISHNSTCTAELGSNEIKCGQIGFPIRASGGIVISYAE